MATAGVFPTGLPPTPPPPGTPPPYLPDGLPSHAPPMAGHGWTMVIIGLVLGTCCITVVGLRIWQRAFRQRSADTADWFALAALPPTLLYLTAAALSEKAWHLNRDFTSGELMGIAIFHFAATIIAYGSSALVRLSILLLYRRVSRHHPSKIFDRAIWVAIAVVLMAMVSNIIGQVFSCEPVDAFWKYTDPQYQQTHGHSCNNTAGYIIATSAISLVMDLAIYLMPIALLWNMQLPTRQKVALWCLFSLGFMAVIAAAIKTYCGVKNGENFMRSDFWTVLWTSLELSSATIAASAPSLRIFFTTFFERQIPSTATDSSCSTSGSRESTAPSHKTRRQSWWQGAAAKRRHDQDPTRTSSDEEIEIRRALERLDMEEGSFSSADFKEEVEVVEVEWKPMCNVDSWNEKEEEEMDRLFRAARRMLKD